MKISLITVSYNSQNTIRETFDSVKSQKIKDFELEYIHVDGLSNDETMKISYDYDDIISIRISEKDTGIYNAMNKGVTLSSGDVIGFLNSDDTFADNDVLSSIADLFNDKSKPDIVYGDIDYVDSSNKVKRKWRTGEQNSFSKGWHPAHPAFYAKKTYFDEFGGFDEQLKIAADFDLMLRFLEVANSHAIYLKKVCVKMKLGGESNRSFLNIFEGNRQILRSFNKYSIKPQWAYTSRRWVRKLLQKISIQ